MTQTKKQSTRKRRGLETKVTEVKGDFLKGPENARLEF
jgi:hypothetical protein